MQQTFITYILIVLNEYIIFTMLLRKPWYILIRTISPMNSTVFVNKKFIIIHNREYGMSIANKYHYRCKDTQKYEVSFSITHYLDSIILS